MNEKQTYIVRATVILRVEADDKYEANDLAFEMLNHQLNNYRTYGVRPNVQAVDVSVSTIRKEQQP